MKIVKVIKNYQVIILNEMNIGWYQPLEDTLYLVELKEFTVTDLGDANISQTLVSDLLKKSIDSLAMILAVKAGTSYSAKIRPCLPPSFNCTSAIKVIPIINCPTTKDSYIPFLRDQFKEHFKSSEKLLGVQHSTVVSVTTAKKFLPQLR